MKIIDWNHSVLKIGIRIEMAETTISRYTWERGSAHAINLCTILRYVFNWFLPFEIQNSNWMARVPTKKDKAPAFKMRIQFNCCRQFAAHPLPSIFYIAAEKKLSPFCVIMPVGCLFFHFWECIFWSHSGYLVVFLMKFRQLFSHSRFGHLPFWILKSRVYISFFFMFLAYIFVSSALHFYLFHLSCYELYWKTIVRNEKYVK